ncbi:glycine N-acyltransferase isoform X2 [Lingula anatina]|uniref:Glycine N-acyltransferase-like protein n=1 Tax=Lingula anatina TaxID=7574 RepID=A0A1S3I0D6_LINAN|nr:glycine N-acyltransferase isoform X2 [Lingula anatina]|eukprot:XP_013391723.1 glycine N-acyltransferase isoform X2 [Lingula anatina]
MCYMYDVIYMSMSVSKSSVDKSLHQVGTANPLNQLELTQLLEHLEKDMPRSLYMIASIQSSQKNSKFSSLFYTDNWPSFSVVISKPEETKSEVHINYYLVYFQSGKEAKGLEFLRKNDFIDWSQNFLLVCPSPLYQYIGEVASEHGGKLDEDNEAQCHILYVNDEGSIPKMAIPDSFKEGVLSAEHSHQVNSEWKYGGTERKRTYIQSLIENFPTVALFTAQGQCIAYMIANEHGGMGMLHVTPEHRGKGCAKYVITTLAKKHVQVGHYPYLYIETDNEASLLLHLKCGFHLVENFQIKFVPYIGHRSLHP